MIRTCKSHTSMHESTEMGWGGDGDVLFGDGVGTVVKCMGWGEDGSQVYGDGVGMERIPGDGRKWG